MAEIELESRVARLESLVDGKVHLAALESELGHLARQHPQVAQLLQHIDSHPRLFDPEYTSPSSPSSSSASTFRGLRTETTLLEMAELAIGRESLVTSLAPIAPKIRLDAVPSLKESGFLVDAGPAVRELYSTCRAQEAEMDELERETVRVLEAWYTDRVRPANALLVGTERVLSRVGRRVNQLSLAQT